VSLREKFRAELAAHRAERAPWPPAIEKLVREGLALDAASQRAKPVDRQRAAEIVTELEAYVDSLPVSQQALVSRALVKRFASETT
jgi:hypothetical protein